MFVKRVEQFSGYEADLVVSDGQYNINIALKENCQVKNGMVISKDYSLHNLNW